MTYDNAAFQDTDEAEAIKVLAAVRHCADSWDGNARLLGNVRASDISRASSAAIKAIGEAAALVATLKDIIAVYEWCSVDPVDRGYSSLDSEIYRAKRLLATSEWRD